MNLLLTTLFGGIAGFLKFFFVLQTIRLYITWFPNLNPWCQPWVTIAYCVDPYIRGFRGIVPNIGGIDVSPILSFLFLTFLIDVCNSLVLIFS